MKTQNLVFGLMLAVLLALPLVLAQEPMLISANDNQNINATLPNPGITPDNPVWAIKRVIERIDLFLTFDKSIHAEKGLNYTRVRLAEVTAMIAENRLDAANKSKNDYEQQMIEVENDIKDINDTNSTKELEKVIALEGEINLNRMYVERLNESILVKTKGNITAEQQTAIESVIATLSNSTDRAKIEINDKKDSVKVLIKAEGNLTDAQVSAIESAINATLVARGQSGIYMTTPNPTANEQNKTGHQNITNENESIR